MKIRFTDFDGTPEEFLKVRHHFEGQGNPTPMASIASNGSGPKGVSPELIAEVLKRRPLSASVRKALKALLNADEKGLTTKEIAQAVGIKRTQLAGVFGAFGNRVASTPGWPDGVGFVEYTQDEDTEEWRCWLSDKVKAVLQSGQFKL
jgi:hypothetical protein